MYRASLLDEAVLAIGRRGLMDWALRADGEMPENGDEHVI